MNEFSVFKGGGVLDFRGNDILVRRMVLVRIILFSCWNFQAVECARGVVKGVLGSNLSCQSNRNSSLEM